MRIKIDFSDLYNNNPQDFKRRFGAVSEDERINILEGIDPIKRSKELDEWLSKNFPKSSEKAARKIMDEKAV